MSIHNEGSVGLIDVFRDGRPDSPHAALQSLSDLLRPLGTDAFLGEYLGRKPFLVKRGIGGYFEQLISVQDVDALLGTTVFHANEIRIAKDGVLVPNDEITEDDVIQRDAVWSHFEKGATIVFEHLNRKHAKLLQLMSACEVDTRMPFRANAYLTPPASRGFSRHYDTHDVLILQVSGSKSWQVYDNPFPLPHETQRFTSSIGEKANLLGDLLLEPGDVLYLPRGFIHSASANSEASFHVTVGIRSVTLHDVCATALKQLLLSHREFRRVLLFADYPGTAAAAKRALLAHLDEVDLAKALGNADLSFLKKRIRPVRNRLLDTIRPIDIDPDTRLRLGPGVLCRLKERNDGISLYFDRSSMRLPRAAGPALDVVCSRTEFSVDELPGLDADDRLALVRKLLHHRVLDVVAARPAPSPAPVPA